MESSIDRLRTFSTVLTKIHHPMVRTSEPQVLFDQAARVAVEDGGFRAVEDYLDKIDIDLTDPQRRSGPTGFAVKTGVHGAVEGRRRPDGHPVFGSVSHPDQRRGLGHPHPLFGTNGVL